MQESTNSQSFYILPGASYYTYHLHSQDGSRIWLRSDSQGIRIGLGETGEFHFRRFIGRPTVGDFPQVPRQGGKILRFGYQIELINTCSVDNFLVISFLLQLQFPLLRRRFRNSKVNIYQVLSDIYECFVEAKFDIGKDFWIQQLNLPFTNRKWDLFSEEGEVVHKVLAETHRFREIWECTGICGRSLDDSSSTNILLPKLTEEELRNVRAMRKNIFQARIKKWTDERDRCVTSNENVTFKCDGTRRYERSFVHCPPIILSVNLYWYGKIAFKDFPNILHADGAKYYFGGVTAIQNFHFQSYIVWGSGVCFYDNNIGKLTPVASDNIPNHELSYAYYFLHDDE